jgi:hypothetical protein
MCDDLRNVMVISRAMDKFDVRKEIAKVASVIYKDGPRHDRMLAHLRRTREKTRVVTNLKYI